MSDYYTTTSDGKLSYLKNGASDSSWTHVLLSKEEYEELEKLAAQAKKNPQIDDRIKNAAIRSGEILPENDQLSDKSSENDLIQENVRLKAEVEKLKDDVLHERSLNKNLLRINRERANSDRKLKPKKQHTGYVVLSSREKAVKYKSGDELLQAEVWETILQTPYNVEFPEIQVRQQILNELFPEKEDWIMGKIGITVLHLVGLDKVAETNDITIKNIAYTARLKANYKTRYWEFIVQHTLPLTTVPKEMLP